MTGVAHWIVSQLGAREHFAIPRALHSEGRLGALFTDAWVPPGGWSRRLPRPLRERHHPFLPNQLCFSCTAHTIAFETNARLQGWQSWDLILRRNSWFQRRVRSWLPKAPGSANASPFNPVLFSFSYTALEPFRWAKSRGWQCVLGQIDGGPADEKRIDAYCRQSTHPQEEWKGAPTEYWQTWRQECELADRIVVNSDWSRGLLLAEQIDPAKVVVVPVAYEPPAETADHQKSYPSSFDAKRPLRVLFLGQLARRKGVSEILLAARELLHSPIEFWMVGPEVNTLPSSQRDLPNIRWIGPVPRGQTHKYYQDADVFLFPTHSDGFGLTQLEAQAWKLPLIVSAHCGQVVKPGITGMQLPEVTARTIANALTTCLDNPGQLSRWSGASGDLSEFRIDRLAERLAALQ